MNKRSLTCCLRKRRIDGITRSRIPGLAIAGHSRANAKRAFDFNNSVVVAKDGAV